MPTGGGSTRRQRTRNESETMTNRHQREKQLGWLSPEQMLADAERLVESHEAAHQAAIDRYRDMTHKAFSAEDLGELHRDIFRTAGAACSARVEVRLLRALISYPNLPVNDRGLNPFPLASTPYPYPAP
jgi:hypothetical protein